METKKEKKVKYYTKDFDLDRTRTCNPQIRSLMPYPLGHKAGHVGREDFDKYKPAIFQAISPRSKIKQN